MLGDCFEATKLLRNVFFRIKVTHTCCLESQLERAYLIESQLSRRWCRPKEPLVSKRSSHKA